MCVKYDYVAPLKYYYMFFLSVLNSGSTRKLHSCSISVKYKQFVTLKLKTAGGSEEGGGAAWKSIHRLKVVGCVSDT